MKCVFVASTFRQAGNQGSYAGNEGADPGPHWWTEPILLVEDLDDTWTRTRLWFSLFIIPALTRAAEQLSMPVFELFSLYAAVASSSTLHEYAFIFEEMFADRASRPDPVLLQDVIDQFWRGFDRYHCAIETYPGMIEAHL
jgi:hypothetical protein